MSEQQNSPWAHRLLPDWVQLELMASAREDAERRAGDPQTYARHVFAHGTSVDAAIRRVKRHAPEYFTDGDANA